MNSGKCWTEAVRVLVIDGAKRVRHLTLHTVHREPQTLERHRASGPYPALPKDWHKAQDLADQPPTKPAA